MVNHILTLSQKKYYADVFEFLPILVLCTDLFAPFLIWKNILPSATRRRLHVAVAIMIVVSLLRMVGNVFQRSFDVLKDTVTQTIAHSVFLVLYIVMARIFAECWTYIGEILGIRFLLEKLQVVECHWSAKSERERQ